MYFMVDVTEVDEGWQVLLLDPATEHPLAHPDTGQMLLPEPRILRRLEAAGERFPLPPANDTDGLPAGLTEDAVPDTLQNILNQAGGPGAIQRFGCYLFNTLLGRALWERIDEAAGRQPIELALRWAAEDLVLNRLPWEIMHTGFAPGAGIAEGFLAARHNCSITRRVAGTQAAHYAIDALQVPPRVLFVVGSALTDTTIRAGAEFMFLLKHLEQSNRQLRTHIEIGATTGILEDAIKSFNPTVVHIICHGVTLPGKAPSLEFRRMPGSDEPDYVDAKRLKRVLETDRGRPLPRIVVLNACSTATSEELEVGRPLAAELVQLGVPIVVGMSGKVADQACRMFTRGFYGALLERGDIALAAARGRWAAIVHGGYNPDNTLDWALPTLYLAERVGEARLTIEVNQEEVQRQQQAMEFSKQPDYPVFCGRLNIFQKYRELLTGSRYRFMAISVPRSDPINPSVLPLRYGSSRMLKELAAQAMRDGHIPVLIAKEWLGRKDWPSTLAGFLDLVIAAVLQTSHIFRGIERHVDLPGAWDWKYVPIFQNSYPTIPSLDGLPSEFHAKGLTADELLAKALMLDLIAFRNTICVQRGQDEDVDAKLLLLIDDCQRLVFSDSLFQLFGKFGLGDPRASAKARGVIAYNSIAVSGQESTISDIMRWANAADVFSVSLDALHESIDLEKPLVNRDRFRLAALIYKHFLLYWRQDNQRNPLSTGLQDDHPDVSSFIAGLAHYAKGVPSRLCENEVSALIFYQAVVVAKERRFLIPADDEAVLAGLAQTLQQQGS